jgi:hypothetical protein
VRRFVSVLGVTLVAIALSSCAVGVREPASEITETGATLNGQALSTTGGQGSYFIRYGPTSPRTERTPTRTVEFAEGESEPVTEPVDGLEPGTTYDYIVCAEDEENPGQPFCSPPQTFKTAGEAVPTFNGESICTAQAQYAIEGVVTGFQPNTTYGLRADAGSLGVAGTFFTTDANGAFSAGSLNANEPFEVDVRIWVNPDSDLDQDPGEPTVIDQTFIVDEPCEDARPAPSDS